MGLKFFEELPSRDAEGKPLIGARTPIDLDDAGGVQRLATMAALALAECAGADDGPAASLLLCLPEPVDGSFLPAGVLGMVCADAPVPIDAASSRAFPAGRIAIFEALAEADRLLSTRAVRAVYLGGVDSLVDRESLDRQLRAGRIKATGLEGFVPGEGAAFIRLSLGVDPEALAIIVGVASAQEPFPRGGSKPNAGEGLAKAGRAALAAASTPVAAVGAFFHGAAGDRFGFREAAMALTRLHPRAEPAPQIWTPAGCSGEIGAAYGPFALAMAATFLHRKVTTGPAALVLGTGDGAGRGAAVVTKSPPPSQGRDRR